MSALAAAYYGHKYAIPLLLHYLKKVNFKRILVFFQRLLAKVDPQKRSPHGTH